MYREKALHIAVEAYIEFRESVRSINKHYNCEMYIPPVVIEIETFTFKEGELLDCIDLHGYILEEDSELESES